MLSVLTWKKNFAPVNGGERGVAPFLPRPLFHNGPEFDQNLQNLLIVLLKSKIYTGITLSFTDVSIYFSVGE